MKASTAVCAAAAAVLGMAPSARPAQAEDGLARGLDREIRYETLEKGRDGAWWKPAVVVVGSAEAWDQAMLDLANQGALAVLPAPAAPDVDWSRNVVVLVSLGCQMQYGSDLEVTGARARGRSLHLDVTLRMADGGMSGDPYAPYQVLAVERGMAKSVHLHYTLETPAGYSTAEPALPTAVAVMDGAPLVALRTWGEVKGLYR